MQNLKLAFGAFCLGLLLLLLSCNDPTLIGSDILEEDLFSIQSTEEVEILARTVRAEPVQTFNNILGFQLVDYLIGQIDDPVFGTYKSSIFTEFELNGIAPNFANATLDSAIILLPFDNLSTYGEEVLDQEFQVKMYQLANQLDTSLDTRYSNEMIATAELLETITLIPSTDSLIVNIPNKTEIQELPPHFRIALPSALAQKIFNASESVFLNSQTFQEFFPGVEFRPISGPNAMFGIQLRNSLIAQMQFFFRDSANLEQVYNFPIGNATTKFTTFNHDFTGTIVEEFIEGGQARGDSLLFVQSMEGTDIELTFPDLSDFQNIIVNKAELVFEIDSLPDDDFELFPPTPQLMVNEVQEDGELFLIEDLGILISRNGPIAGFASFGGSPNDNRTYSLNISGHFQRIVDGEATNVLRITPINGEPTFADLSRGNRANRVVIKGPKNDSGRMKLILNYTKI